LSSSPDIFSKFGIILDIFLLSIRFILRKYINIMESKNISRIIPNLENMSGEELKNA
jgi:uncharacterized membrane protein SirB2